MSGKAKKPNALKHGATSQEPMLWGEKQEDYDALREGLALEWAPNGPTEEILVQTLLDLLWRSRRISLFEKIEINQKLDAIRNQNELSDYADWLRGFVADFEKATTKELVDDFLATFSESG